MKKTYDSATKELQTPEFKVYIEECFNDDLCKKNPSVKKRLLVLRSISLGMKGETASETFKVARKTIIRWTYRLINEGLIGLCDKKRGHQSKFNNEIYEEIRRVVKLSPTEFGFKEVMWTGTLIAKHLVSKFDLNVSYNTALKYMHMSGLKQIRPKKSGES